MKHLDILIVDDDIDFAESLAETITGKGYSATVVNSGTAAINAWKAKRYDLTFMDVKMPGLSGVDTFFEIMKIDPRAKIIMMTGYRRQEDLRELATSGAVDVLSKPLDLPYLLKLIRKTIDDESHPVLVVDDDKDFMGALSEVLENNGLSVLRASTGAMAIKIVRQAKLSAMLIDLRLPEMNGFEVCEKLHRLNILPPTIVITAYKEEAEARHTEFAELGISSYLYKPFTPDKLFVSIDRVVDTHPHS